MNNFTNDENYDIDNDFPGMDNAPLEDDLVIDMVDMPAIPEGPCRFTIKGFHRENNCPTAFGIRDKIAISFLVNYTVSNELKEELLTRKYNLSRKPTAKLVAVLKALTGGNLGASLDLKKLTGIHGTAEIVYIAMEDGGTIADIQNLTPDEIQ